MKIETEFLDLCIEEYIFKRPELQWPDDEQVTSIDIDFEVPQYSTDEAAAQLVKLKIAEAGPEVFMAFMNELLTVSKPTPYQICVAAMKALGHEIVSSS